MTAWGRSYAGHDLSPRTRPELDREEKVDEIVAAAERQLRAGGWPALSMARVARELGLAQAAIYWYFPSKDHLFVAAMERIFHEVWAGKPPKAKSHARIIVWFIDRLAELRPLILATHERARQSDVVAEFEDHCEVLLRQMLLHAIDATGPDAEVAASAFLAVVEGLIVRDATPKERAKVIEVALARLFTP